jgi:hypothetical protein
MIRGDGGLSELMIVNPVGRGHGAVRFHVPLQQEATMAKVQGMKEKLHWPLYDAFVVPEPNGSTPTFATEMQRRDSRVLRFFVDVQNKTKLETNLQASGALPSLNSYEVRALRVVVSPTHRPKKDPAGAHPASDGMDSILTDLIYNSVTSLLVGEKTMIEMPTYFFPSGAGVSIGAHSAPSHGEPDPTATFRFSEPVLIEPNQNFRVEMLFPQGIPTRGKDDKAPLRLGDAIGPMRLWVVLDGYLTRDVQ